MINGLEGIMGSGKSYEATAFHVLTALKAGRKVITNLPLKVDQFAAIDPSYRDLLEIRTKPAPIRGTWDANRLDENGNGQAYELFEDGRTEPAHDSALLFGTVWCYYSTWRDPKTGQGALFVVDECHVGMPKIGTDKQVVQWYKLSRHFGADVLLMTQAFRDMDQSIARLLGMLVKVRKADILGRKDSYIRKVHGGYRGAVISTEERKYRPELFPLYKSHTQGGLVLEAGATDVAPFTVKFRRFSYAFYAFTAAVCVWAFWPSSDDKPAQKKIAQKPLPVQADHGAPVSHEKPPKVSTDSPAPASPVEGAKEEGDDLYPEPYAKHSLHVTGWMSMGGRTVHTFAVAHGVTVVASVTTRDLERAGYSVQSLSECVVVVHFGKRTRSLVCDLPQTQIAPGMQTGI